MCSLRISCNQVMVETSFIFICKRVIRENCHPSPFSFVFFTDFDDCCRRLAYRLCQIVSGVLRSGRRSRCRRGGERSSGWRWRGRLRWCLRQQSGRIDPGPDTIVLRYHRGRCAGYQRSYVRLLSADNGIGGRRKVLLLLLLLLLLRLGRG